MFSNFIFRILFLAIFTLSVKGIGQESELEQETYTLQGVCVQDNEDPKSTLQNVEVKLFYVDRWLGTQKLVATTTSNMRGMFRFDGLKRLKKNSSRIPPGYVLLARSKGFASARMGESGWIRNKDEAKLMFSKAGKFGGRITDQKGKPIDGVAIYDGRFLVAPAPGFTSAKTNANGEFELTDIPQPTDEIEKRVRRLTLLFGSHPKYGRFKILVSDISAPAKIRLSPAYQVEGKVVDSDTGRPKSNCLVVASLAHGKRRRFPNPTEGAHWVTAITNEKGKYSFGLFSDSDYNIFTLDNEKSAAAISISNHGLNTAVLDDIRLSNPVEVKGQVIDSETGKPITSAIRISWYGPDRPRTGSPVNGTMSNDDGSFTLKMVAGKNTPYVATTGPRFQWKSISIRDGSKRLEEIDVDRKNDIDLKIVVQKTKR